MVQKFKNKKLWIPAVAVFALVGAAITNLVMGAGTATFSLSPASGSHDINTNFTVSIVENSGGETVNSVQADLTYDQSKLQFVSLSTAGSPFSTCTQQTGGSGSVSIVCTDLGSTVTGSQTVGSVTFKALVGSGSTSVNFAASSHIVRSPDAADVWNGATAGGTYTLTTPAAPPTNPPPTGSSGGTSSGSTSGGSTSSGSTSGSTSTGSTSSGGSSTGGSTGSTGSTATTSGQNPVTSNLVAVKVVDNGGKPVSNADVTLGNKTTKTDSTGIASFVNVAAGKYNVKVKTASAQLSSNITVKDQPLGQVQQFEVKVKKPINWLLIGGVLAAILVAIGVMLFFIRRQRNKPIQFGGSGSSSGSGGADVITPNDSSGLSSEISTGDMNEELNKVKADKPQPATVIKPHSQS